MATTILHLTVSPRSTHSFSRRFGRQLIERLRQDMPGSDVLTRDLCVPVLPQPDERFVNASLMSAEDRTEQDTAALSLSEELITELRYASIIVIDTPMHNYTVPASLKAWIDYIVRPNRTFRNTENGKIGLLANRPVFLIVASGGPLAPGTQVDHLTPYMRYVFQTIGITDFRPIALDRMRRGPNHEEQAELKFGLWIDAQAEGSRHGAV